MLIAENDEVFGSGLLHEESNQKDERIKSGVVPLDVLEHTDDDDAIDEDDDDNEDDFADAVAQSCFLLRGSHNM